MMKITTVGTLTPAQCEQLAYDLLELFYQSHRSARSSEPSLSQEGASWVETSSHQPPMP